MRIVKAPVAAIIAATAWGCAPRDAELSSTPVPVRAGHKQNLPRVDSTVHLVPIGNFPKVECERMARDLAKSVPVRFDVLPPLPRPQQGWNAERGQFAADMVGGYMYAKLPKYDGDLKSMVVGLTTEDLYSRSDEGRFTFTGNVGTWVIVSMARMDPANFGQGRNADLVRARLRKMILRRIGAYVYGMPYCYDPGSVMYGSIGGLRDIDRLSEDFLDTDVAKAARLLPYDQGGGLVHVFTEKEQEQGRERSRQIDREIARQQARSGGGRKSAR